MRFPYIDIYEATSEKLIKEMLPFRLKSAGYTTLQAGTNFLYAPGEIPVMLVAHVDTVHFNKKPDVYFDPRKAVLYSTDGCGGDDRAGISGILEILRLGYRPHILFTDLEEKGCVGAKEAADALTIPDVRYIIELDRRNAIDSCYYQCDNPAFETYVNYHGFKTAFGSYTDICQVCPKWGIAGVNLSVGYYGAHTTGETVKLIEWHATIAKVAKMLKTPPKKTFKYIPKVFTTYYSGNKWNKNAANAYDDYGYSGYGYEDDYDRNWQNRVNQGIAARNAAQNNVANSTTPTTVVTVQTPGEKTLAEKNANLAVVDKLATLKQEAATNFFNKATTQQAEEQMQKDLVVGLDKKIEKILERTEQRPVFKSAKESAEVLASATPAEIAGKEIAVVDIPSDKGTVVTAVSPHRFSPLHEEIEEDLSDQFFARGFRYDLHPADLSALYGGDEDDWASWIDNNIEKIDELVQEAAEVAVHKFLTENVNDILPIIAKEVFMM